MPTMRLPCGSLLCVADQSREEERYEERTFSNCITTSTDVGIIDDSESSADARGFFPWECKVGENETSTGFRDDRSELEGHQRICQNSMTIDVIRILQCNSEEIRISDSQ